MRRGEKFHSPELSSVDGIFYDWAWPAALIIIISQYIPLDEGPLCAPISAPYAARFSVSLEKTDAQIPLTRGRVVRTLMLRA